jgi:membrane protease YdiL (CAAX protease family)
MSICTDPSVPGDQLRIEREGLPWGFWVTIGFTAVIVFVIAIAQASGGFVFFMASDLGSDISRMEGLGSNGFLISVVTLVSAPVVVGLIALFVKLGRRPPLRDYLALRWPHGQEFLKWVVVVVLVVVVFDGINFLAGRPLVTEFVKQAYLSAGSLPLLWIALIILAPIQEETLFRGFMFKGIEKSRLGPVGAVILSSAGWAILHVQYDLMRIVMTFIGGLVIGTARYRTKSLHVCLAMHMVWNLIAVAQVDLYYRMLLG